MIITLDTNVLIAAFISRGLCSDLLLHCSKEHTLITSRFILNEFTTKLSTKFRMTKKDSNTATKLIAAKMQVIQPEPLTKQILRDKDDDNILATAITGNCHCLITGDKDLLVLKSYQNIPIIQPNEFWKFEAHF